MATKTVSDAMHDGLVTLYGSGSVDTLLQSYYAAHPTSGKRGTQTWLTYMRSRGATGPSHGDVELDFWLNGFYAP